MRKSKHSETKILKILAEAESGRKVADICREHGISQPTFYNWRSKYGGMQPNQLKELREMKKELTQYKKMYAELAHQNHVLKDVIEKKL